MLLDPQHLEPRRGKVVAGGRLEHNGQVPKFVRVVERLGEAVQAEVNLARLRHRSRVQQQQQRAGGGSTPDGIGATPSASTRDLAEDVTDVEDFIAKPHFADRFARVNAKSLRDLTSVRSVARFARSALNDSDWGSTARSKERRYEKT